MKMPQWKVTLPGWPWSKIYPAWTKSEARAMAKKDLRLDHLPAPTLIEKLEEAKE